MTPNDFFFFTSSLVLLFCLPPVEQTLVYHGYKEMRKVILHFFYKNKQTKMTQGFTLLSFLDVIFTVWCFFSTFGECVSWPHRVATPCRVFPVKPCLFSVSREVELESVWTCHDVHILNITQQRRTLQVFSLRSRWIFNCDITWSNIMSFILRKMFFTE